MSPPCADHERGALDRTSKLLRQVPPRIFLTTNIYIIRLIKKESHLLVTQRKIAMLFHTLLGAALAIATTATPIDQQPILEGGLAPHNADLITESVPKYRALHPQTQWLLTCLRLEKANIIPTILDPFTPLLTLNATWKKATADIGNTIKPKKAKKQPLIHFFDTVPSSAENNDLTSLSSGIQLTVALTDPDAPSRDNPEWSQICHWVATNVQLSPLSEEGLLDSFDDQTLTEIMPYKPPGPPPKTGKHRYVFVALAPTNGTTEPLNLSTPKDRQHWGFKGERAGLREWIRDNGLGVVGKR